MKTCPYCAEEIQDAAIVCRYCGRDLPILKAPQPQKQNIQVKRLPNIWAQSAKVALVLTVLASIPIFTKYQNAPAELVGNIFLGLPVTFLVWWLVVSAGISLWQNINKKIDSTLKSSETAINPIRNKVGLNIKLNDKAEEFFPKKGPLSETEKMNTIMAIILIIALCAVAILFGR